MRAAFDFTRPINFSYSTGEGGSVEFIRVGLTYELVTRNSKGDCISTVRMSLEEARELMARMAEETHVAA